MAFLQQLSGWIPFASSTSSSKASSHFDEAIDNSQPPNQSLAFGVSQPAATSQQGNPTNIANWWQPSPDPSDWTDFQDVVMEDWDDCGVSGLEYDASFGDDGNWDPTDMLSPFTPMNLDFDQPVYLVNSIIETTIPGIPSYKVGFWGSGDTDYVMVDADDTLQIWPTFSMNRNMPSTIPPPYAHGHPVLHALDVDCEVDRDDDILMRPTQSELYY